MVSKWQRDIWDAETSTWTINPDYEELDRETILSGVADDCTPKRYRIRIITDSGARKTTVVSEVSTDRLDNGNWSNFSQFGTVKTLRYNKQYTSDRGNNNLYARQEDAVFYFDEKVYDLSADLVASNAACNAKINQDELDEIDDERYYDNEPEEDFKIYPIGGKEAVDAGTLTFDMPVSDFQIVTDNIGTSNDYLDSWLSPQAGYQIEFVVISYESDGTTPDMWTSRAYTMDEAGQRGNLLEGKDGFDYNDIYAHYLYLISKYEQIQADQITGWQNTYQDMIDEEEARLRAIVTESTELVETEVVYEKTTKDLYVNKGDFLDTFTIKGGWEWLQDGQVLYLNDDDDYIGEPSGAVKIIFNTGYNWDVRIGFESGDLVDHLEKLGWAEADDGKLELLTDISREERINPDDIGTRTTYIDGVLAMQIKGVGGQISFDVDRDQDGIAGWYLRSGGRTWELTNWKIDDEVMVNISNPTRTETVEVTTYTNGLGEVVDISEEDITPPPEPPKDDDDDEEEEDDENGGGDENGSDSNWGWWILGGIVVVAFGLILWKITRPVSQNRPVSSGSVPPSNPPPTAPVVVNVEGGGGAQCHSSHESSVLGYRLTALTSIADGLENTGGGFDERVRR